MILFPGDKIHIAFPLNVHVSNEKATEEAHATAARLIENYDSEGVVVVFWDAVRDLTHPTIVSVIRDPESTMFRKRFDGLWEKKSTTLKTEETK